MNPTPFSLSESIQGDVSTAHFASSVVAYTQSCALHPVTCPDSFSEPADGLPHILARGTRKGRPKEEVLGRLIVFCSEPAASRDQHALVNARVEDFLLYLGYAARTGVRVELVVDTEPLLEESFSSQQSQKDGA